MVKKGQAAMEFLLTYGWAILVVLVVIGALAMFGVLNPTALLPERCVFEAGMICNDHLIDASGAGQIKLALQNQLGQDITITGFKITTPEMTNLNCENKSGTPLGQFNSGNQQEFTFNCDSAEATNQKVKVEFSMSYKKGTSDFEHTMHGELLAKIEE